MMMTTAEGDAPEEQVPRLQVRHDRAFKHLRPLLRKHLFVLLRQREALAAVVASAERAELLDQLRVQQVRTRQHHLHTASPH